MRSLTLAIVFMALDSAASWAGVNVVTTLATFADLFETVGGDYVDVTAIASPKFNPHFINPRPSDVLRVKRADIFAHAGLDLEAWRGPLVSAAGNMGIRRGGDGELDLSREVRLLEVPRRAVSRAEGDIHLYGNPHYWLDPENAKVMIRAVAEKLGEFDPGHKDEFDRNASAWIGKLEPKIAEWRRRIAPYAGREILGYHNEWPYLIEFLGLTMDRFLEPKPGVPPTPKHLQVLTNYMKEHAVSGIVQSSYFPTRSAKTLSKRTGAAVVLLCQNVHEVPEATGYIAMMEYNVNQLVATFSE